MKRINLSIFFIFTLFTLSAWNIRQISNNEGLSNSAVLSIYQDSEGLMWFGTCDGLNMFDGSNVQLYKSSDKNNLSGNLIEDMLENENGVLWLQTNYGINRIEMQSKIVNYYSYFIGKTFLRKTKDNYMLILKDDNVLYYYHSSTDQINKTPLPDVKFADLHTCLVDANNRLKLFFRNGMVKTYALQLDAKGVLSLQYKGGMQLHGPVLYGFTEDNSYYYVDALFNFYEYDTTRQTNKFIRNIKDLLLTKGDISSVIRYKNDYFIGFKTNGVVRLIHRQQRAGKYDMEVLPVNSGVFCIYKDHFQDVIWIGTDGQGVFLLYDSPYVIKSYPFNNILYKIEKPVRSLIIDRENTLWVGTKGDGILKVPRFDYTALSGKKTEHIRAGQSALSNNSVYAFAESSRKVLWIGHEDGIDYYSYSNRSINRLKLEYKGKTLKYIHSICEVNDTTLWLASVGMGIIGARISGPEGRPVLTNVRQITLGEGKENFNHFFTNYADGEHTILYGNRGHGLCRLNTKTYEVSSQLFGNDASNQLLNDVFSIFKDKKGNIWCGTSFGLVKYVPATQKIKVFNEQKGFPNNTIHGILEDPENNLWLSTNQGLVRFDTKKEIIQAYGVQNGLKVTEFSDGAYYKDQHTGNLLFGGISGFVTVEATDYHPHAYTPDVVFNGLNIFGQEYNLFDFCETEHDQTVLNLNYNQNFFTLSYTANDYIDGNNYNYYYQLSGQNEQWIDNKNRKTVSFTNIAPQEYTLQVKYVNKITGYESPVYSMIINIRPPWYRSALAYTLYVLLVMSAIVLTVMFLIRKSKKKRQEALERIHQQHQVEVHESKLRFFTNIAHEFCTPLTLIYGPCNRILSYSASDRFVKENTRVIQRNAERLNTLIQELIEFRRIETENRKPQIEEVPVSQLSYDIIRSFSEIMDSKGFRFEHQIQPDLVWNTDKSFIYTVVTNLLSNALKYTNYAGTIRMKAEVKNDRLEITISNTGKGIRKEDYDHVFDRYTILDNFENKEDKSIMRNGLGLAISYNLVKLLKGEIAIESELNINTSFIIRVPQNELTKHTESNYQLPPAIIPQESAGSLMELPEYPVSLNKQTIFIIDDDIEILWLICEIFKEQYNVVPFNTISSIDELLKNVYPDIIISDIMMSGMDGISIVKQIKANKPTSHIPLILISAKHDVEEQIKGVDAGAELYITKPFNIDFLKVTVSRLIKQKENLKDYFSSPLSAFDLLAGKKIHKEDKEFLEKVLMVINEHLKSKELSAAFIASELNTSTRQLYRKISELGETSLSDMIKECKLHVAKNLLLNTQMTIDEIAYNSGFSNRATFYNVFAAKYNTTPKEYRKKSLSDE